jgi:hypothetical protein
MYQKSFFTAHQKNSILKIISQRLNHRDRIWQTSSVQAR